MWKWLQYVICLAVFCAVIGEDFGQQDSSQEDRDFSEIERESWRNLRAFQDDDNAWIPRDRLQDSSEVYIQKRRRLRKRKRRPVTPVEDFNSEEFSVDQVLPPPRRRVILQRLDRDPAHELEPWKEMTDEAARKPNLRRRISPTFQPSEERIEEDDASYVGASINIEEDTLGKEELLFKSIEEAVDETNKNVTTEEEKTVIPDLKAVLKQSGTGSLSEILQQKNLSLSELLMGNQKAISALTEMPQEEVTEAAVDTKLISDADPTKYKRLPPSVGLRKHVNRNFEQEGDSFESLSTREMLEAQRKRLSLLGHKDNKLFSTVTKYDVVTEPTTERRIFVPSHSKYYTSSVFRPDLSIYSEQSTKSILQETAKTEATTTTTTTPKTVKTTTLYLKPKLKNLPLTNAKLSKITAEVTLKEEEKDKEIEEVGEEENYPIMFKFPKPIPINIQEVTGYQPSENKFENKDMTKTDTNDEPVKVSIDLDMFVEKTTENSNLESYSSPKTTPSELSTTEEFQGEKVAEATAKDEIMEIMRDPISRERLSRILETRNMTVKELVEQRERGSSQLHLADIFHNKTREPEPKEEPFVGIINTEYFNSFPLFGRQQRNRKFQDEQSKDQVPVINPTETAPVDKITDKTSPEPIVTVTSFPAVKIGVENTNEQIQPFPWESDLPSQLSQNNNKETNNNLIGAFKEFQDNTQAGYSEEELQRLEDIDSTFSLVSNEKLNIENAIQQEDEVLINIPTGVKSAIFVSLAIICLSIVVFLTILLVFKWTQRQNKRINYCNSLSAKIRSPMIIQRRPATAIKSFMTETLGRKKNYYKSNVQSTDDLWECGRERIPSF